MAQPTEKTMILALTDIAGFNKVCSTKSDSDVFRLLDRFYCDVDHAVREVGGRIVKTMGDAVFIVFPAENPKRAIASITALKGNSKAVLEACDPHCRVRIHAHVGSVAAGSMGIDNYYDVIGAAVNELFCMPWDGPELSDGLRALVEC